MVNPLPLRNLNRQTFQQKVQELLQLLLNNPVRTLLALLLTRGLWLPILKRGGYFFLVGLGLLSQLVVLPIEFLVGRLPPHLQEAVWDYLEETVGLVVGPFSFLLRFAFRVLTEALARPLHIVRVLD